MTKNVVELIRVSTEGQADDSRASIPAQRSVNRRTCEVYGLEIVRSIEIVDVSGSQILMSPEMQELLRIIANPDIHGVVAREFSRIMRPENYADFGILQRFAETNTLFYPPEGPIDFSSKSGRILGTVQAVFAGNQRLEFLENVWNSKEEKRRKGENPQSKNCLPNDVGCDKGRWFYKPEAEKMREAFRLLLSGDTSYVSLGRKVGIDPYTLRAKLKNPIYTGWRVIDKKRDPSLQAHRTKLNGRQADRPKIMRAEHEIIRVQVIEQGLISMDDFNRAQQILDIKRTHHWRAKGDHVYRFIYNGFLTCSQCGEPVYTKLFREDYYACKGHVIKHNCPTRLMRRDRVDPQLDILFSTRLTDRGFLRELLSGVNQMANRDQSQQRLERLVSGIEALENRRERVLSAFYDGVIDTGERNAQLSKINHEIEVMRELLFRERPSPELTVESLATVFKPFDGFEFLTRDNKRRLLSALGTELRVADYCVEGVSFCDNVTHTAVDYHTAALYLPLHLNLRVI